MTSIPASSNAKVSSTHVTVAAGAPIFLISFFKLQYLSYSFPLTGILICPVLQYGV